MAKPGPAPEPTALKKLKGNPGKRPLNEREPTPPPALPRCPMWLGKVAKREWRRLARDLHRAGILTLIDRDILAMFVDELAAWLEAAEQLEATGGKVLETPGGRRYLNPWQGIRERAKKAALSYGREIGLTPSSRSQLIVTKPEEEKSLADLLFDSLEGSGNG